MFATRSTAPSSTMGSAHAFAGSSPASPSNEAAAPLPSAPVAASVCKEHHAPPSFEKTIKMNNVAAQHLERGDYEKAIKAFTVAFYSFRKSYRRLSSMEHSQESSQQQPQQSPCTDALFFNSSSRRRFQRRTSATTNKPVVIEEETSDNTASLPAVVSGSCCQEHEDSDEATPYCNAIYLPTDFPITKASCGFLSTAITFNLALANHLYGMELDAQVHLKSAGRLYEYCLRLERARALQAARVQQQQQQPLFASPLVLMCVLNNLGHLHTVLGNTSPARKCYTQLQTAVVCWMHLHKNDKQHDANAQDLIQSFMENCLLALKQVQRSTAAAA